MSNNRKKRIQRIRLFIIWFVFLFIIATIVVMIVQGIQISHLQKQVDELMMMIDTAGVVISQ